MAFVDEGATVLTEFVGGSYTESEGDRVGSYTLRQKLGEGGFGTVWMAEQHEPIQRTVALKVVKAGMDTTQVLARFEAERQAVAMMDHPNIAKILDAGATDAGRPYFAMELIDGVPITEFCREQKLDTKALLELFRDVCSAVNHAHQKGIIHRDLKPSNVMVTVVANKPVVKVIDFGIAKATESKLTELTFATRVGQFIGTPVYMSPEQAAMGGLDIDTRSDIYSLGVLLYELLVGKPPFDAKSLLSAGYDEMRRIIAEDDPPKPSTRLSESLSATSIHSNEPITPRALQGDLDWIVMKAIEKERTRRYESVNSFAADLGRYLGDEPVEAAAPSRIYRFKKFARRNKAAFVVSATIAVVMVAATALSSWQAVRATQAQRQSDRDRTEAVAAQLKETLAREEADAARMEEKQARLNAEEISKFLTGIFESSRPGGQNGGRQVRVADILDPAANRLETQLDDQPDRRARLQATIAETYSALGLYAEAIALQEKAMHHFEERYGMETHETLSGQVALASYIYGARRLGEASTMLEELLPVTRRVDGPANPLTLDAMQVLGLTYFDAGQRDKALKLREEVFELCRKVNGDEHEDTIAALQNLAISYEAIGRHAEALAMREEALRLSRKVIGEGHPKTHLAMANLGHSYWMLGHLDEAIAVMEEVLELSRKVSGAEHPDTIWHMINLGTFYFNAGREKEALAMREEAWALSHKRFGAEHPQTLASMQNLAISRFGAGRQDEALEMQEQVLALRRRLLGPNHPDTGHAAANLGFLYDSAGPARNGDGEKTIAAWQEAVPIHPDNASLQYHLGKLLMAKKRYSEALAPLQAVLALFPDDPGSREVRLMLAQAFTALGRDEEAAAMSRELAARPGPLDASAPAAKVILVPPDSEWKWLHPLDGVDPGDAATDFHSTFFAMDFDDASWQTGKDSEGGTGGFGYGDDGFEGVDIGTPDDIALGKSAYFRHRFSTTATHPGLELRCRRDDGIIIYLDGKEVARDNMVDGEEAYRLPAERAVSGDEETTVFRIPLNEVVLPAGEHVLAISLHNPTKPSSDLRIGGITLVEVDGASE